MSANTSTKDPKAAAAAAHTTADGAEVVQDPIQVKDRRHGSAHSAGSDPAQDGSTQADTDPAAELAEAEDPRVVALEAKLAHSETRLNATLGQYKDALDEFASVKARLRRDIGKEIAAGKRTILGELLEVLDNLERAIEAAKTAGEANDSSFFKGVSMVRDQFLQKLESLGVQRRLAAGQPFDPDHFEAISTVPVTDKAQDGVVLGVVRDCYMLGEETLRHGMVAVGKFSGN